MIRGTGCLDDEYDPRDGAYPAKDVVRVGPMPDRWDLSGFNDKIRDQGKTQSCVGHALTTALYIRARYQGLDVVHGSPAAVYAMARAYDTSSTIEPLKDDGSRPRSAVAAIKQLGVPKESNWPLADNTLNLRPSWSALRSGSGYKPQEYRWINETGSDRCRLARAAIVAGYPVTVSIASDDKVFNPNDGVIEGPVGVSKGGHYVALCGYNKDGFFVINSWGESWADKGLGLLTDARLADISSRSLLIVGVEEVY